MTSESDFLLSEIKRMQRFYLRSDLPLAIANYIEERYYPKELGEISEEQRETELLTPVQAINLERVKSVVLPYYEMTWEQVSQRCRKRELVLCRQKMMYFLRVRGNMTLTAIGRVFNMDHTSVIHNRDKLIVKIATDDCLRKEIEFLNSIL